MRMRKRPNLAPRMEKCAELMIDTEQVRPGGWHEQYPGFEKLYVELGCGKGRFTADTAVTMSETLLLAVELVADAMIIAMERVRDREIKNVRFINGDAAALPELFARDEVDRIYINFCDPWPKSRDAKFRLTAPAFLRLYAQVLPIGGEIHFKTDNRPLFDWSVEQFNKEGWQLEEVTNDLHAEGIKGVMTDYEAKFHAEGVKINRLVARRTSATLDMSAGTAPRLHDAALRDSIGYEESKAAHKAKAESEKIKEI